MRRYIGLDESLIVELEALLRSVASIEITSGQKVWPLEKLEAGDAL